MHRPRPSRSRSPSGPGRTTRPWAQRVGGLHAPGRCRCSATDIGLPWPEYDAAADRRGGVSRSTGGYAGIFDPGAGTVEIAYYADDFVVLHEAAHAWFNGALLADRWANEAFASYYATTAAAEAVDQGRHDRLTDELEKAAHPAQRLGPGRDRRRRPRRTTPTRRRSTLARQIAERAGDDGLQAVWADVSDRRERVPAGRRRRRDRRRAGRLARPARPARGAHRRDVRRPVADVGRATRGPGAARRARWPHGRGTTSFLGVVGDWQVPLSIRDAMRAWRFDEATELIDGAEAVLELRGRGRGRGRERRPERPAGDAARGLRGRRRVRRRDRRGRRGARRRSTGTWRRRPRRPAALTPLMTLGLWGETPEADLAAARDAFARGELAASAAASDEAAASWVERRDRSARGARSASRTDRARGAVPARADRRHRAATPTATRAGCRRHGLRT